MVIIITITLSTSDDHKKMPIMMSGVAWMITVVVPMFLIVSAIYFTYYNNFVTWRGDLLPTSDRFYIIMLSFIASAAVIVWVWKFHIVVERPVKFD